MNNIVEDRREFIRLPFERKTTYEISKEEISIRYSGNVINISENGAAIKANRCPNPGEIVLLDFTLPNGTFEDIKCKVIWAEDNMFGIQFTEPREEIKEALKSYFLGEKH